MRTIIDGGWMYGDWRTDSLFPSPAGMTQKYLGMVLGFPEKSADVRLAQYETGEEPPKVDLASPHALSAPSIDSHVGFMNTLFIQEDNHEPKVTEQDGGLSLRVDFRKTRMLLSCTKCFGPGGNRRLNWKPERSPRRITTAGVITTRSTTAVRFVLRCRWRT